MIFNNDQLLDIAHSVKLSMPESDKKEVILRIIRDSITKDQKVKEVNAMEAIDGIPDQPGENWYEDLTLHRKQYYFE